MLTSVALGTLALLLHISLAQDISSSLKQKLSKILPQSPCVQLLQFGASDVGCSGSADGESGILSEVISIAGSVSVQKQSADPSLPYTAVIASSLVTDGNIRSLLSQNVRSFIVIPGPIDVTVGYSPAARGPGPYAWNPTGKDVLSKRYGLPFISVDGATGAALLSLARRNQADGLSSNIASGGKARTVLSEPPAGADAKYALFSYFPMGPVGLDTNTCITEGSCIPLGGQSVWGSLGTLAASTGTPRPLLLAVTGMDATGLFHDQAYGADAAASGIVAVLAAADALGRESTSFTLPLQPAFALFQGDNAWGRIGSRRWLKEIQNFTCQQPVSSAASSTGVPFCAFPVRPDLSFTNLSATPLAGVIAVDQVGHPGTATLYAHATAANNPLVRMMAAVSTSGTPVAFSTGSGGVQPPTSLDSWVECPWPTIAQIAVAWNDLPQGLPAMAALTAYDGSYTNLFYGSRFDNASNVDASVVAAAATALARSMYALCLNSSDPAAAAAAIPSTLQVNASFVASWLRCLTQDAGCPTFASLLSVQVADLAASGLINFPISHYPGIYNPSYSDGQGGTVTQPSLVELAVRNQLLLSTASSAQRIGSCNVSLNMDSNGGVGAGRKRQLLSLTDSATASVTCVAPYRCIVGQCILPSAFFHEAYSPAVEPTAANPYAFTLNATAAAQGRMPPRPDASIDAVWAEPYWSGGIGASLFVADSRALEIAWPLFGVLLCLGWAAAVHRWRGWMEKTWSGKAS